MPNLWRVEELVVGVSDSDAAVGQIQPHYRCHPFGFAPDFLAIVIITFDALILMLDVGNQSFKMAGVLFTNPPFNSDQGT